MAYGPVGRPSAGSTHSLGHRSEANSGCARAIELCERRARALPRHRHPDLGELLHPSTEARRLLDQALIAADDLSMTSLSQTVTHHPPLNYPPRPPNPHHRHTSRSTCLAARQIPCPEYSSPITNTAPMRACSREDSAKRATWCVSGVG